MAKAIWPTANECALYFLFLFCFLLHISLRCQSSSREISLAMWMYGDWRYAYTPYSNCWQWRTRWKQNNNFSGTKSHTACSPECRYFRPSIWKSRRYFICQFQWSADDYVDCRWLIVYSCLVSNKAPNRCNPKTHISDSIVFRVREYNAVKHKKKMKKEKKRQKQC